MMSIFLVVCGLCVERELSEGENKGGLIGLIADKTVFVLRILFLNDGYAFSFILVFLLVFLLTFNLPTFTFIHKDERCESIFYRNNILWN